jgi:putative DNA primase/helicase
MATNYRNPEAEFGDFIRAQGLVLDEPPIMDGRVHRISAEEGRRGNKDGAYKGYLDGLPSGWVTNYRNGDEVQKWSAERERASTAQSSPEDQAARRARWRVQQAQREAQAQADFRKAASLSQEIWESLSSEPVNPDRTYLHRKQVANLGVRFAGDDVVVPVRDIDGQLWSLQTIKADTQAAGGSAGMCM